MAGLLNGLVKGLPSFAPRMIRRCLSGNRRTVGSPCGQPCRDPAAVGVCAGGKGSQGEGLCLAESGRSRLYRSKCSTINTEDTKFCQECGTQLLGDAKKFCISCGAELTPDTRFCGVYLIIVLNKHDKGERNEKGICSSNCYLYYVCNHIVFRRRTLKNAGKRESVYS